MIKPSTVWKAQKVALSCVYYMWAHKYKPRTIFNVGMSMAFEVEIWNWQFPGVPVIAIDPGAKRRAVEHPLLNYIQACASDHIGTLQFCNSCRSTRCRKQCLPEKFVEVQAIAIDDISSNWDPPYFIWMDTDGGELAAMQGAKKTLEKTEWLNIEIMEWLPGDKVTIDTWLSSNGYTMFYAHHRSQDRLYRKTVGSKI